MSESSNVNSNKLINDLLNLIKPTEESVLITNKHKVNSRLAKNNHIFSLLIKKNEIEYIKDNDHFKNKMKYIVDSDTLLYRNHPIDPEGKKFFFNTLNSILKEIKKNNTWVIKNKL